MIEVKRALLSVSDKTGLGGLARGLAQLGVELLASGGTAERLRREGLEVREIGEYTGSPELLGGRVKTLHPAIHAGILARRDEREELEELEAQGLDPIDLVVVNLYPFEGNVQRGTPSLEAMAWVDIGGEALIRAAAKNFPYVGVLVDPGDYQGILAELARDGGLSAAISRRLAAKAFSHVTRYNAAIARWFTGDEPLPEMLTLAEPRLFALRYGENPHQQGALYGPAAPEQLQGKALSYLNLLDADAALKCASQFERPTVAIIKHATPCGVASADSLEEAFQAAYDADAKSAFGGIVGVNRPLDGPTAEALTERFLEVVVAPDYSEAALKALGRKENVRVLLAPDRPFDRKRELRATAFGLLVQEPSPREPEGGAWETVTSKAPTSLERRDLLFAWRVVKHVKSNAIVLARGERTVGIGGGQVSRVDAAEIALKKAGDQAVGSVMASDAFFPFRDSVDIAAQSGIEAIIQPGGSVRDEEVIRAAEERGVAMVFTRRREFKH